MDLLSTIVNFIGSLFNGSPEVQVSIPLDSPAHEIDPLAPPESPIQSSESTGINWTDGECQVTEHFKVKDCLTLHSWGRLATEADGADFNKLVALCSKMEQIREILNAEINVHSMFRSVAYNQSEGIRPAADVHSMSLAIDFDCNGSYSIEQVKEKIEPLLSQYGIRLEKGTVTWVHVDLHSVGPSGRYFTA